VLPIRDANPASRVPAVTVALIALNVAAFVLWQPTLATGPRSEVDQQLFFLCHAAVPWELANGEALARGGVAAGRALDDAFGPGAGPVVQAALERRCPDKSPLASLVVAMFLHGGWLHLLGNMLFLWIFGNNVEDRMHHLPYLVFYLVGGVVAFALQFAFAPDSAIPTLGASGAVAAVLGAYLFLFPGARVTTLVFFFFVTIVELPALIVLGLWFVLQLVSGVGQLSSVGGGGVAYWAHVGGFAFGYVVALVALRGRRPTAPLLP
jgi:membrane associated rhomboid family serine protease